MKTQKHIKDEIAYLRELVTPQKAELVQKVVSSRTRHITVALEDVYQPHNASAILRSCEIFGVQDVHIIEQKNRFAPANNISMGAGKKLNLHQHKTVDDAYLQLKKEGYLIAATSLTEKSVSLYDLPIDQKIALVFGTERIGISPAAQQGADLFVAIPMYGFTQSFNVSVSVALCLQSLILRLQQSTINWKLSQEEQDLLTQMFLRQALNIPLNAPAIIPPEVQKTL